MSRVAQPSVAGARLYGRDADLYDRIYGRPEVYAQAARFVAEQTGDVMGARILDLCAGTGTHAACLCSLGARVLGVDRSAAMIAIARTKAPIARFIVADVRDVNLRGPFDAVVCLYGAIHYTERDSDMRDVLRRSYEWLVPGGALVFELRDRESVSAEPLCERRAGLEITTFWERGRGVDGSDLYVVAAYDAHARRHFVEVHNLFLTVPSSFVDGARAAGFADVQLRAGYTEDAYAPHQGSDVAVLVGTRPRAS